MTLYDLDAPRTSAAPARLPRVGHWFTKVVRAIQYSRLNQAMSQLSDEQLRAIDLTRADIRRYSHDCIYKTNA